MVIQTALLKLGVTNQKDMNMGKKPAEMGALVRVSIAVIKAMTDSKL